MAGEIRTPEEGDGSMTARAAVGTAETTKDEKRSKKRNREKKDAEEGTNEGGEIVGKDGDEESSKGKEEKRAERVRRKDEKRAEKQSLLERVPQVDEHGVAYTRVQIRRMTKRVKRGLPAVPTEEEERERMRNERVLRIEEERELAGEEGDQRDDLGEEGVGGGDRSDGEEAVEAGEDSKYKGEPPVKDDDGEDVIAAQPKPSQDGGKSEGKREGEPLPERQRPLKKKPRSEKKPVPLDYVCFSCQNERAPPAHWIYDCPDKVTVRGRNQVSKRLKGVHQPDARKVFVSGLPFDAKQKDVETYFANEAKCGKVVRAKLLKFDDKSGGSGVGGRCKGQAILTFETEEGAQKAMKLTGTILGDTSRGNKAKKGGGGDEQGGEPVKGGEKKVRKELRLRVSRLRSRAVTKNQKGE